MSVLESTFFQANYGGVPVLVRQRGNRCELLVIEGKSYYWVLNPVPNNLLIPITAVDAERWLNRIINRD